MPSLIQHTSYSTYCIHLLKSVLLAQINVLSVASDGTLSEKTYCGYVHRVVSLSLTVEVRCRMPVLGEGLLIEKVNPAGFGTDVLDLDEVLVLAEGSYLKTGDPNRLPNFADPIQQ